MNRYLKLAAFAQEPTAEKQANAWAKAIASGALKSPAALERLAKFIPKGITRQIGKAPLGRGMEGVVQKGFTGGGVGNTAIKTFYDNPRGWALENFGGMFPQPVRSPWKITGGDKGVQTILGKGSLKLRSSLMRENPNFFPAIHGTHARGYVSELLREIPWRAPHTHPKEWISRLRGIRNDIKEAPEYLIRKGEYIPAKTKEYGEMYGRMMEVFRNRHKPIPELRMARELSSTGGHTPARFGEANVAYKGKRVGINDFDWEKRHNVMLNSQGRAVISDPIITGAIPAGTPRYPPRMY